MAFPARSGPRRLVLGVPLLAVCLVVAPIIVGATNGVAASDTAAASDAALSSTAPLPSSPASPGPAASIAAASPPTTATPSARPATAAIATLLIYSGRPDPSWSLTQEDLDHLAAITATLAPGQGDPPEGGLGYRGFRVIGPQGTWRAYGGVVVTPESAPGTSLSDPERLVERYLLERGLGTLADDEVAVVTEALGPG